MFASALWSLPTNTTITITSSTMAVTVTAANTPPTAATTDDDVDPQSHSGTVKMVTVCIVNTE